MSNNFRRNTKKKHGPRKKNGNISSIHILPLCCTGKIQRVMQMLLFDYFYVAQQRTLCIRKHKFTLYMYRCARARVRLNCTSGAAVFGIELKKILHKIQSIFQLVDHSCKDSVGIFSFFAFAFFALNFRSHPSGYVL